VTSSFPSRFFFGPWKPQTLHLLLLLLFLLLLLPLPLLSFRRHGNRRRRHGNRCDDSDCRLADRCYDYDRHAAVDVDDGDDDDDDDDGVIFYSREKAEGSVGESFDGEEKKEAEEEEEEKEEEEKEEEGIPRQRREPTVTWRPSNIPRAH